MRIFWRAGKSEALWEAILLFSLLPTYNTLKMAEGLKIDPAIERWAHLRENTHLYFAWNKRNARRSLFWGIAIPVGLTIISYGTDVNLY